MVRWHRRNGGRREGDQPPFQPTDVPDFEASLAELRTLMIEIGLLRYDRRLASLMILVVMVSAATSAAMWFVVEHAR